MAGQECGELGALAKFVNEVATQDRSLYSTVGGTKTRPAEGKDGQLAETNVEYFEFRDSSGNSRVTFYLATKCLASWTDQFKNSQTAKSSGPFPESFEAAFQNIQISTSNDWTKEFSSLPPPSSSRNEPHAVENAAWIKEYSAMSLADSPSHRPPPQSVEAWVEEFQQQLSQGPTDKVTEEDGLRETAMGILENLQVDQDSKLAKSRFVAYLRQLADQSGPLPTHQVDQSASTPWKDAFLSQISSLTTEPQDQQWTSMEKAWDQYEATGFGYAGFANREFGAYHYSVPIAANPYNNRDDLYELVQGTEDLKTKILILESILAQDDQNSLSWRRLGEAQQANEMDPQAIAALLNATRLNPTDPQAWLGLAASCTNESCIPEATEALVKYLSLLFPDSARSVPSHPDPHTLLPIFEAVLRDLSSGSNNSSLCIATSVLNSIVGNHERAAALLCSLGNNVDWTIRNRFGASLANTKQYDQAIQIYDQLLNDGHPYPRIHYNKGISLLCQERFIDAARSFVRSIESQLPVDILTKVNDEVVASYRAPWEALGVAFSLAGVEEFADCRSIHLDRIKAQLAM